jgi:mono/diheme cytochrome c family protein
MTMKQFVLRSRFVMAAAMGAAMVAAVAAAEQAGAPHDPAEEYGEWFASPNELANVSVNRIARSLRLNRQAMALGKTVYNEHCAACHGADSRACPISTRPT